MTKLLWNGYPPDINSDAQKSVPELSLAANYPGVDAGARDIQFFKKCA
jgi:hypothetical protein